MEILDNYLPSLDFQELQANFIKLPWKYSGLTGPISDDNYQLHHNFFTIRNPYLEKPISSHAHILKPLLLKLSALYILRIKANFRPKTSKHILSDWHVDIDADCPSFQTAILYINSNDGYTEFKDGTKVESIANRLLIFPTSLQHRGASCTNCNYRMVLNLNFAYPP